MIIVLIKNNDIYITFNELIKEGVIEIEEEKQGNSVFRRIKNSDFEKISLKDFKNKITLRIKQNDKIIFRRVFRI